MTDCPFCLRVETGEVLERSNRAAAFVDRFPISRGHTLVVPTRHEADFFALTDMEQAAVWVIAKRVRDRIVADHQPTGFNIGINVGADAGQTIEHAHLHLIPRYPGDVADPRGGIRWAIPDKAPYWVDD
jgi:diadenosine tetraphosphate (Ap4A) HIT family hydrolase